MDSVFEIFGLFFKLLFAFGGITASVLLAAFAFGWIWATEIKQGTATAFLFLGRHVYTAMEYKDHHFEPDGEIQPGPGPNSHGSCWAILAHFGGWVFYIVGLVKPAKYVDFNTSDDGFGDKESVFLHEVPINISLDKAETKKGATGAEAAPVDIKVLMRAKVCDVGKLLFVSPKDVVAQVNKRLMAIWRRWVRGLNSDQVLDAKTNGNIWADILGDVDNQRDINNIRDDWGIEIVPTSASLLDVDFQKPDQEAQASARRQDWEAKGAASELMGSMLEIEAKALGLKDATEAREHLKANNPARLKEIVNTANDTLIQRKLGGGYRRFDVPGLAELATLLLNKLQTPASTTTPPASPPPPPPPPPPAPPAPPSPPQPPADPGPAPAPTTHKPPKKEKSQAEKAEAWFKAKGVYPKWDPLKRTPN